MEKLGIDPNKFDFRKAKPRPKKPVHADQEIEGSTEDDINDFAEAVKAAKESVANRKPWYRRMFGRE